VLDDWHERLYFKKRYGLVIKEQYINEVMTMRWELQGFPKLIEDFNKELR